VVAVRLSISPAQSSLYIPASAKSSKKTAKNSRSFRTPSPYPQENQRNSQKEDPPLFPHCLSKHSPLPQCKNLSSIMDGVSWMKRNEWTINPFDYYFARFTTPIKSRYLVHEVPARGPINRWMTDSYSTRRTSILDDKNEIDGWYINLLLV
jgi:hypothetical protein